ncbi:DNA-3-methyladenine glycosylase [Robbsia sp. Bb-Pol-6]|uniref:DNA-3-methyladenine glycosylase II n=1 Tax=Robbsia betulipollinis TaxID=2981849 RepID=A0ABT3ZNZ8_9BURK|nr:DNA-3-methyladenine glycosylase [Robbsia betulipollinis]MCY0387960.1 DNA-3-methyladenine glycosylase [Robbsia betulipollinis]
MATARKTASSKTAPRASEGKTAGSAMDVVAARAGAAPHVPASKTVKATKTTKTTSTKKATAAGKAARQDETAGKGAAVVPGVVVSQAPALGTVGVQDVVLADGAVVHRGHALPDAQGDASGEDRAGAARTVAVPMGAVRKDAADAGPVKAVAVQIADLIPTVVRPEYWEQACADLMKRDRILKKLIPQFGPVHLKARGDPFVTLARSIIGQQISVKAAQSVWERVLAACPDILPAAVVELGYERLAACGLSRRKAEYILDLGQHFVGGALHVDRWASMDDEDVIEELTRIRGIGRWTAEMFLIFNLMRPDVLPLDDLGLIKAISVNYFSGEPVTRSEAREVAANWEPWRTVATWYMWRSLEPVPVVY